MVEYVLLVAFVAVACLVSLTFVGSSLEDAFDRARDAVADDGGGGGNNGGGNNTGTGNNGGGNNTGQNGGGSN